MSLKIVLAFPEQVSVYGIPIPIFAEKILNEIREVDCEIVFPKDNSEEELLRLTKDADVIIVGGGIGRISGNIVENASRLKLIQAFGAGVEGLPFNAIRRKAHVSVASTSGTNSRTVAEHAFALILALSKHVVYQHNLLQSGTWHRLVSIDLSGKTMGIIGYGRIGIEVAKIARAFGMRVVATKRHLSKSSTGTQYADQISAPGALIKVLEEADFIVLCVPSTPETRDLIGEREFRSMKKTAYFINVSRGSVVNEEALYNALRDRWLAGAGIDTWYNYPPNREHNKVHCCHPPSKMGIHLLDNVVMTPHVGGLSVESVNESIKLVAENIQNVAKGRGVRSKVNVELGY